MSFYQVNTWGISSSMEERLFCKQKVNGSGPLSSTIGSEKSSLSHLDLWIGELPMRSVRRGQ